MNKDKLVQNERVRLAALFTELPREKFYIILGLIDRAAFLKVELDEMQKTMKPTDSYQNGNNQSGEKMSAALQAYNQTTKVYQKLVKELMEYMAFERRSKYRPSSWDEDEYLAFRNFTKREELDFFLSDEFRNALEEDRAKALELMLEGN